MLRHLLFGQVEPQWCPDAGLVFRSKLQWSFRDLDPQAADLCEGICNGSTGERGTGPMHDHASCVRASLEAAHQSKAMPG